MLRLLDELTDPWTPSTPSQSPWHRLKATPPWHEALPFWSRCISGTGPSRPQIWESVGVKGNKPRAYLTHSFISCSISCTAQHEQTVADAVTTVQTHCSSLEQLKPFVWKNHITWYISTRCSVVRACGFGALKMRNSALTKVLEFRSTLVTSKPTILKYGLWGTGLIESVEQKQDSLWPYLHFVVWAWYSEGQPQGNKTCFSAKTADAMTNPFQPLRGLTEL